MFSQTLSRGNSKNVISQRNRRRRQGDWREYGKKEVKWSQKKTKKTSPNCLSLQKDKHVVFLAGSDIFNRNYNQLIRWFLTATSGTKPIIVSAGHVYIILHQREKRGSTILYGYGKWGTCRIQMTKVNRFFALNLKDNFKLD